MKGLMLALVDQRHDADCEAEWIDGAKAYTTCACEERREVTRQRIAAAFERRAE